MKAQTTIDGRGPNGGSSYVPPTPRRRWRRYRLLLAAAGLAGAAHAALSARAPGVSLAPPSPAVSAAIGQVISVLPPLAVPVLTLPAPAGVPVGPVSLPPAVADVVGVATRCGEEEVHTHPLSPHAADVAVVVTLANSSRTTALAGRLSALLSPGAIAIECDAVAIPPGGVQAVACWLALERAPAEARVELRLSTSPSPSTRLGSHGVQFSCVAPPPAHNVVVRSKNRNCPALNGAGGLWLGKVAARAPRQDRTYCAYSWHGGSNGPDLRSFRGQDWELDIPVVVPLDGVALEDVAAVTGDRLGIPRALEAMAQLPLPATRVTLAVLDAAARDFGAETEDDSSDHGRVVGLTAHRVACGDLSAPACPVDVDNRLAMPIVAVSPRYAEDAVRGGFFGTRAQLAVALHDLLDDWEAGGQAEPLVINLSLGWHSKHDCPARGCGAPLHTDLASQVAVPTGLELFGLDKQPEPREPAIVRTSKAASEAVLLELVRARCLGALVIAAAGNAVGGDRDGPLLPGAWNQLEFTADAGSGPGQPAPQCVGLVDMQRLDLEPAGYGKPLGALVEAVGATAFDGQVLATTRWRSLPRLNAYGAGITLQDARPRAQSHPENPGWLRPASGTSLATAVVAGAAARLWAQVGQGIAAHRILDQLHLDARRTPTPDASGDERLAELFPGAKAPPAREVTACTVPNALGVACSISRGSSGLTVAESSSDPLPEVCLLEASGDPSPKLCPVARDPLHQLGDRVNDCPSDVSCPPEPPAIDTYEAPWVMPQPWGITCATCSEFHESFGAFTAYAIDLDVAAPAFSGWTSATSAARRPSIIAAAVRTGTVRSDLALTEIKHSGADGLEILRGRLYLDLWVEPAPASLIVKLMGTAGTLSVMTEAETALISMETP